MNSKSSTATIITDGLKYEEHHQARKMSYLPPYQACSIDCFCSESTCSELYTTVYDSKRMGFMSEKEVNWLD